VLFKEKAWGEKPWVLIAYIPDSAPVRSFDSVSFPPTCLNFSALQIQVQERMTYSTGIGGLKEALGDDQFSTVKRFAEPVRLDSASSRYKD
jgi:RecJ-like exonuclease